MSGDNESSTPLQETSAERLARLNLSLDEFEESLGLPLRIEPGIEQESRDTLKLSPMQLRKLSRVECGEKAVILRQFAFFLQQAANKQLSDVHWAEESIKRMIADTVATQPGYSYDERRARAVKQHDAASKVDVMRVQAQLRHDRIAFLSTKVGEMAQSLMSLQMAKRE